MSSLNDKTRAVAGRRAELICRTLLAARARDYSSNMTKLVPSEAVQLRAGHWRNIWLSTRGSDSRELEH